jgi:signal transduction histidine kinase
MLGAAVFMAAGFAVVRAGLAPFKEMRRRLGDVQSGAARQLLGDYPSEVRPLVRDLNALLTHHEAAVGRAIARAGDLAHGLKTPLAVLSHEADRAAAAGQHDLAGAMTEQVERMRRQIEYHLAHARAAASGATASARSSVAASVAGLSRTLLRLHADRGIAIDAAVASDHAARCQPEDLDEMLGNLLDNACKWGKSRIEVASSILPPKGGSHATSQQGHVTSQQGHTTSRQSHTTSQQGSWLPPSGGRDEDRQIEITVDDDGPGLDPSMREAVLQRGVRADEAAPGSGFGLAIVREIARLYGGSIALEASPLGGLRARLSLPIAPR